MESASAALGLLLDEHKTGHQGRGADTDQEEIPDSTGAHLVCHRISLSITSLACIFSIIRGAGGGGGGGGGRRPALTPPFFPLLIEKILLHLQRWEYKR
jgi:hypothetical protein